MGTEEQAKHSLKFCSECSKIFSSLNIENPIADLNRPKKHKIQKKLTPTEKTPKKTDIWEDTWTNNSRFSSESSYTTTPQDSDKSNPATVFHF